MNRMRPLISPAKVIKFCLSLLSTHLQTLYTDLDPVKDFKVDAQSRKHYRTINHRKLGQRRGGNGEQGSLSKTSSSLNLHYLFPLLSMLAINAHSAYLLCKTNFTLYDGSPEMDRLFSHRLFPRTCWPQGDVIANVGFVLAAAVFLALLLQEPFSSKSKLMMMSLLIVVDQKGTGEEVEEGVRMFQDGKEMNPEEALLITRFRRRISSAMPALMATFYLEFGLFCLVNFFVNSVAAAFPFPINTSFSEIIALLFTLLIIVYLPFSNFFLIYYFSLCIKYLLIKQGRRMRRAETLLQRNMITTKNSSTSSSSSSSSVSTFLAQVSLLYGSFARLCAETAGQNRFWSLLLTLYYLSYIIEIVHFSYVFLFVPNTIGPLYYVLLLGAGQFLAILVYVTTICSRLTRAGDRLHRRLQQVLFEECCQPADDRHLKRWRETRLLLPAALRLNQMAAATSDTAHGQMPGGHLSAGHRAAD